MNVHVNDFLHVSPFEACLPVGREPRGIPRPAGAGLGMTGEFWSKKGRSGDSQVVFLFDPEYYLRIAASSHFL